MRAAGPPNWRLGSSKRVCVLPNSCPISFDRIGAELSCTVTVAASQSQAELIFVRSHYPPSAKSTRKVCLGWRPPSRIGFEREMICSLIRKQLSKRDDGYGSIRSRAATAVDKCRKASDCGGESGAWGHLLSRSLGHMTFTAIWLRLGGGRRAQAALRPGADAAAGWRSPFCGSVHCARPAIVDCALRKLRCDRD